MRQIYQSVESTGIWLGQPSEPTGTKKAVRLIFELAERYHREPVAFKGNILSTSDLDALKLPSATRSHWKELDKLFWKPWFTRAWIIQEAAVSRELIVHIGDMDFSFEYMRAAAEYIRNHSLTRLVDVDPQRVRLVSTNRETFQSLSETTPLYRLFPEGRRCYATDPRDKIYTFLGLGPKDVPPELYPD